MNKIPNGYYIKARIIQDSKIAHMPPHVREIWDWLIKEANWYDNKQFKRGETMRTIKQIQDGLCWYIGYRKMTYSKGKCEMALKWLRNEQMITTTKTTRGMYITVCKYDIYQDPKNYERNSETNNKRTINEQSQDTINKEDIINKEKKKEIISTSSNNSFKDLGTEEQEITATQKTGLVSVPKTFKESKFFEFDVFADKFLELNDCDDITCLKYYGKFCDWKGGKVKLTEEGWIEEFKKWYNRNMKK